MPRTSTASARSPPADAKGSRCTSPRPWPPSARCCSRPWASPDAARPRSPGSRAPLPAPPRPPARPMSPTPWATR
ncbi:hypothetical protein EST54_16125 [Streptomyces sioyaensis]|uniref:Uncharacterized protein n=1 Tax=Streptomyces sioyaensis TaxID=67364 RepID=A0A4Q1QSU3_9ACTN|nr:hypothetical protein EST54_16125 [Streptomyces sioyaensis]